jgi:hypothetical protein
MVFNFTVINKCYSFVKLNYSNMRLIISLLLALAIISCKDDRNVPDVSHITADLKTYRFEKELFAFDTTNLAAGIDQLISKYPSFGEDFLNKILNTDPLWNTETTLSYLKGFVAAFRPVYDSSEKMFRDFTRYEKQLEKAVQYLKHYFPAYKVPQKIITYIGPLDGVGDALSEDAFIVGLHSHMGKSFSLYQSSIVSEVYPSYIVERFEPDYIQVNAMKNVVNDMFPEKSEDKSLVIQMVEKGKRLYALSKLLPDVDEYMLIGYTEKQLKDSYKNERVVWDLFVQNNFLQTTDYTLTKNYIGEGPKTMELGEGSPGNIGSFSGWQIVKKYMEKKPEVTLTQLMNTDPEVVFSEARYKP